MKRLIFTSLFFLITVNLPGQIDLNFENKLRLAQTYEQSGQLEKAENIYREIYELQSWNFTYLNALNKVLVNQKKYNESISLLESQIKATPADINLYGILGSTYYMMDNIEKAYDSWERGIQTNPNSYITYRVMANYAIENRTFEKAIEILQRGKSFSGDPVIFSLDLANIYSVNMRFDEAAEEYCSLISIKPDQIVIVKSRFQNYFSRPGAMESTIRIVKKYADQNKLPVFHDLLSFCYSLSGMNNEAFESIKQFDKKVNAGGNYIFGFAQETYRNRQFEISAKAYKYIVDNYSNSPLFPIARIGYSRTLEEDLNTKLKNNSESWKPLQIPKIRFTEEYKAVINSYSQLAKAYPDNSTHVEAIFRIAEIYFNQLNDYTKADSLYDLVIRKSSFSNYTALSLLAKGKIAIKEDRMDDAKNLLNQSRRFEINDLSTVIEVKFYQGLVDFWNGDFSGSLSILKELLSNLNNDFANDAIEYSALISASRKDSINLVKFAKADRLLFQNKLKESIVELKTLADNHNLFVLNEFANYKLAEIFLVEDDFFSAVQILENLSDSSKTSIFADKSTFLLGMTYQFGIVDLQKAASIYQKMLEKFPNSLYFDKAREYLNATTTKSG
jgi:tetratricopeptide (TPR) repeat protein